MSKSPSMSKIRQKAKQMDEMDTIYFYDFDKSDDEIQYYPEFSEYKITNLLKELRDSLQANDKYGIDLGDSDDMFIVYVLYHAIKIFSTLTTPSRKDYKTDENYYKTDIQFFNCLVDTGYFKWITDHFQDEQVFKIFDRLQEIKLADEKLQREIKRIQNEIQNLDLQSPELQKRLQPNKNKIIPEV